jgi:hypothetical protein
MKKMSFKNRSNTPLLSAGLLIATAPRMLELFAHYTMPVDLKDFMTGLGVALVAGSFILSRLRPTC